MESGDLRPVVSQKNMRLVQGLATNQRQSVGDGALVDEKENIPRDMFKKGPEDQPVA